MGDTVIIRRTVRRDFTTLPNELIRDNRLSWAALGLLVYVLSLPNDFRLRLSHLAKQKTSGRDATRSAAKVLEGAGYLKIRQQRGYHGRFTQTTWEVTDTPDAVVDVAFHRVRVSRIRSIRLRTSRIRETRRYQILIHNKN